MEGVSRLWGVFHQGGQFSGGACLFIAGFEVFEGDLVSVLEGDEPLGFKLKGAFELFVRLGFEEGVIGGEVGLAELLHEAKRGVAQGFVGDLHEGVERLAKCGNEPTILEQFGQHDIAHAETKRGQVVFTAGDELDEVVVSTAAGDGPEFAQLVERLVNRPCVVGQAADDSVVDFDEVAQAACLDVAEDGR